MTGQVHEVLVREDRVSLLVDEIEQGLDADELRVRGGHDGVAHLLADDADLLQQFPVPVPHAVLVQLVEQGASHPAGQLVRRVGKVVLPRSADGEALGLRSSRQMLRDARDEGLVEIRLEAKPAHVIGGDVHRRHRGSIGHGSHGRVQDAHPWLRSPVR